MSKKRFLIIFVLALGYGAAFTPVYMKYVLYEPLLDAFNITKSQVGYLIAIYTVLNTLLYIPGGYIADKYSLRKILSYSLIAHSVLCFALYINTSFLMALVVWFLFGITTGFAFWSGLLKAVLSLGTKEDSAIVTGFYGLMGALVTVGMNLLFLQVYYAMSDASNAMGIIFLLCAIIALVAALLIWIFYKDIPRVESQEKFEMSFIKPLLKNKMIWLMALVILSTYAIRVTGNTYFNPFLLDVYNIDSNLVSNLGILRSNIFPLLTPVAGFISSRYLKSTAKLLQYAFYVLGFIFLLLTLGALQLPDSLVIIASLIPGLISGMTFGVAFSVVYESSLKPEVLGTAIGLISLIVYLPDFVVDPVFGTLLDTVGNSGYSIIFICMFVMSIIGIIASKKLLAYRGDEK